jgi:protein phosphatase
VREPAPDVPDVRLSLGVPLAVGLRTDVGRVRANNEDAAGVRWLDDGSLLVIVADGMGGHEAGEVASNLAVEVIGQVVARGGTSRPQATLHEALVAANQAILDESRQAGRRGMGTTSIVAWVRGEEVHVGLVGDSRLYLVRGGRVAERTIDHTRVQSLLDRGAIRPEEARDHPESGMLTRALGHARMSNGKPLEPEVFAEPLELGPGDAVVLSTDGLHDLVDDWEIALTVAGETPERAAEALVELALDRGGHDNVTVAVVAHGARASELVQGAEEETMPVQAIPAPRSVPTPLPPAARASEERLLLVAGFAGVVLLVLSGMMLAIAGFLALP